MRRTKAAPGFLLGVFLCLFLGHGPAAGWGLEGHRRIGDKAMESLVDPLRDFFEDRDERIYELLDDPARDRGRATFFLDRYGEFPFEDVPSTRELALRRFSEERIAESGDAAWRLLEAYRFLVGAFEDRDFDAALEYASDVIWLVGELSAPPNVASGGDGSVTAQDGLANRFDAEVPDAFARDLDVRSSRGVYLDRPEEFILALPVKAWVWVDNILYADLVSRRGVSDYDRFYMESMWGRLGGLIGSLMSDAARDAASLCYTAWVASGRPDVPDG